MTVITVDVAIVVAGPLEAAHQLQLWLPLWLSRRLR